MNRLCALILLLVTSMTLACGSSNRQLQSIDMSQTANGQQIEFVAAGNFSSSPTSVPSIPVEWSVQLYGATAPAVHADYSALPVRVHRFGNISDSRLCSLGSKRSTQRVVVKRQDDSGLHGNQLPVRKRLSGHAAVL
jgi:hypothetical protein